MDYAKLAYTILPMSQIPYGNFVNGNWTGLYGLLLNGSIDTVNVEYFQLPLRRKYFSFPYATKYSKYTFLVRNPSESLISIAGVSLERDV